VGNEVVVVVCAVIQKCEWGRGGWAKKWKPSGGGAVSVALIKMGGGGDRRSWWGVENKVVVVVGVTV